MPRGDAGPPWQHQDVDEYLRKPGGRDRLEVDRVMPERNALLHVVDAIADAEGVEPHELEYSLHEHVHTEAIRGLVEGGYTDWELTFRVPNHEVCLRAEEGVYVDGELVAELDGDGFDRIE